MLSSAANIGGQSGDDVASWCDNGGGGVSVLRRRSFTSALSRTMPKPRKKPSTLPDNKFELFAPRPVSISNRAPILPSMTLTVLTNGQAESVLDNLTPDQLRGFQSTLIKALSEYSAESKAAGHGTYHQPPRVHYSNPRTGVISLFMPSIAPSGLGVKVVTLSGPQKAGEELGADSARPVVRPTGAVTLFAPDGSPKGFLHAGALTAFRTALASSDLVRLRSRVRKVVVFGAGKQAYWHLRLTLLQKGDTIERITAVNRSKANAVDMLSNLSRVSSEVRSREGWSSVEMDALAPEDKDYQDRLAERLQEADVIICCTPSTADLFSSDVLTSGEGGKKTRLIVAVGSYTPHMRELPEKLLLRALDPNNDPLVDGGTILVDTREGVMTEAGEIIQAGIKPEQLLELGEIPMLRDPSKDAAGDEQRARWLKDGNVVFKCVGLGLMDLIVGTHLIDVAAGLGLGTQIEGFES